VKLALGTVQFGLNYGVANKVGQVDTIMASSILQLASRSGIDTLDTAIDYGNSENLLGKIGVRSWKVVTKLPAMPQDCSSVSEWVNSQVFGSLKRLGLNSLYGLLLHRPSQLLERGGADLYSALKRLKADGLVSKVGISVYGPEELDQLFDRYSFDLVQAPLNILDRRLLESGWTQKLEQAGIELHTRSAFLQGLLLMPANERPNIFRQWSGVWMEWDRWLYSTGLNPLQACLYFLNSISSVNRIIVGVDSSGHMLEIIQASNGKINSLPKFPDLEDQRIINPSSWHSLKD
jgi:aryl-alcohol dehydrogenase-like predicted oxidoreductase